MLTAGNVYKSLWPVGLPEELRQTVAREVAAGRVKQPGFKLSKQFLRCPGGYTIKLRSPSGTPEPRYSKEILRQKVDGFRGILLPEIASPLIKEIETVFKKNPEKFLRGRQLTRVGYFLLMRKARGGLSIYIMTSFQTGTSCLGVVEVALKYESGSNRLPKLAACLFAREAALLANWSAVYKIVLKKRRISYLDREEKFLIAPHANFGSFYTLSGKAITDSERRALLISAAEAINHLHRRNWTLCSIQPKNLLINQSEGTFTVFPCPVTDDQIEHYFPPEYYEDDTRRDMQNVFSLAVVFWRALSNEYAYPEWLEGGVRNATSYFNNYTRWNPQMPLGGVHELLRHMMSPDPEERPTMESVVEELHERDSQEFALLD